MAVNHKPRNAQLASELSQKGVHLSTGVTVQAGAAALYQAWRSLGRMPQLVNQLEYVEQTSDGQQSHWSIHGANGKNYEWTAEVIQDKPGEVLAWRSATEGIQHSGAIRFRELPFHRGTEIRVVLAYVPPGGPLGKWFETDPTDLMATALARFRQFMEAGEVATTSGQPVGGERRQQKPTQSPPGNAAGSAAAESEVQL